MAYIRLVQEFHPEGNVLRTQDVIQAEFETKGPVYPKVILWNGQAWIFAFSGLTQGGKKPAATYRPADFEDLSTAENLYVTKS